MTERWANLVAAFFRPDARHPVPELILLFEEIFEPLVDLAEKVGARPRHILIPQLDEHLGDSGDRAHGVDRVILTGRYRVAAHHPIPYQARPARGDSIFAL